MGRTRLEGLPGHELTHLVQQSLYLHRSMRNYPQESQWLVEGWAVVSQTMIAMQAQKITYPQARHRLFKGNGNQCAGVKLRDLLNPVGFHSCIYPNGFLAMEHLMWKTGDMEAGWTSTPSWRRPAPTAGFAHAHRVEPLDVAFLLNINLIGFTRSARRHRVGWSSFTPWMLLPNSPAYTRGGSMMARRKRPLPPYVDIEMTDDNVDRPVEETIAAPLRDDAVWHYPQRGRPSLTGKRETSPHVGCRVSPELREQADALARDRGITLSQLAREALEHYVEGA